MGCATHPNLLQETYRTSAERLIYSSCIISKRAAKNLITSHSLWLTDPKTRDITTQPPLERESEGNDY